VASVGDWRLRGPQDAADGEPLRCGHNENVEVTTNVRPFRATHAAGVVGALFAGGLTLSLLYATTGVGLPCPFRAITGWDCPLCGGTRMGDALLHGDIQAAFGFNPLALIGLLVVGVLGIVWGVEAVGGPAIRPPRRLAERLRRIRPARWLMVGLLVAVIYTIVRNIL
jgi:Protein of unknown function (DUF2752)